MFFLDRGLCLRLRRLCCFRPGSKYYHDLPKQMRGTYVLSVCNNINIKWFKKIEIDIILNIF